MNKLVEKLESQKARLPLEDHSIIDWAVGAIRIRMQQKEELMDEIEESLNKKATEFIDKCGKDSNPEAIYKSFTSALPDIIGAGSDLDYDEVTGKVIRRLKTHLNESLTDKDSLQKIFKGSSKFCEDKADEIEKNLSGIDESEISHSEKLLGDYKRSAKDLRS